MPVSLLAVLLLGAEDTVARIAKARDNITMVVELLVHSGNKNIHVGMIFLHTFHALGGTYDAHELYVLCTGFLQEGDGGGGGTAGCQHGVYHNDVS